MGDKIKGNDGISETRRQLEERIIKEDRYERELEMAMQKLDVENKKLDEVVRKMKQDRPLDETMMDET